MLSRLAHLSLAPENDGGRERCSEIEVIDDAVFVRDWVVIGRDGRPQAKLQVQGGMIGVGLLGVQERAHGRRIMNGFTHQLTLEPEALAQVVVRVRDPLWVEAPEDFRPVPTADHVNAYGWDGQRFLGADNVRAVSD